MFAVENVIRSATRKAKDIKNILIVNEMQDYYINDMCQSLRNNNFYIIQGLLETNQWSLGQKPFNLNVLNDDQQELPSTLDFIICTGRGMAYEQAMNLSKLWHLPLIVLDVVNSKTKVPVPLGITANILEQNMLLQRNGFINVSTSESIKESWINNNQGMSLTIEPYAKRFEHALPQNGKILIDKTLPSQFINELPFNLNKQIFTTEKAEACIYIHLWQHITPLVLDCMASEIPVVCIEQPELQEFIDKKSIITLPDVIQFGNPNLIKEIFNNPNTKTVINNAMILSSSYTKTKFVDQWSNLFAFANNLCYYRGVR